MSGTMTTPAEKVNEPETQKSSDEEWRFRGSVLIWISIVTSEVMENLCWADD